MKINRDYQLFQDNVRAQNVNVNSSTFNFIRDISNILPLKHGFKGKYLVAFLFLGK